MNIARRDLTLYDVEVLLKQVSQHEAKTQATKSWLTDADAKDLLTAIDYDASEVYLNEMNRWFSIQYRDDKVWLSPVGSAFVPCGWFTVAGIRRVLAHYDG